MVGLHPQKWGGVPVAGATEGGDSSNPGGSGERGGGGGEGGVSRSSKKRRKKMQKVNAAAMLGFTVNAAERPNVGEIQSVKDAV